MEGAGAALAEMLGKPLGLLASAGVGAIGALWARKADVGRMVTDRWDKLAGHLEGRCERAEKRCDAAEFAHDECRDELSALKGEMLAARSEIEKLMRGRVANIGEEAPK